SLDEGMIANVAALPYPCTDHHMCERPHARAGADRVGFNEGLWVIEDRITHILSISRLIISSNRTTSTPILPPLIGALPVSMQSTKWRHSAASGSWRGSVGMKMSPGRYVNSAEPDSSAPMRVSTDCEKILIFSAGCISSKTTVPCSAEI